MYVLARLFYFIREILLFKTQRGIKEVIFAKQTNKKNESCNIVYQMPEFLKGLDLLKGAHVPPLIGGLGNEGL